MSLTVAVQMDHISTIAIEGDTTFALMLEASRRGHRLFHTTPDRLSLREGIVEARLEPLFVRDQTANHFDLGQGVITNLAAMDAVLLRQDPPFDLAYITTTHLLERIHSTTLVVNDPGSVRDAPEKIFVTRFSDLMPPTLISRDWEVIRAFRKDQGDIIIKPLYGNGGAGVFRLTEGDQNLSSLLEIFETTYREPFVVQRYLPEVREGDKRIILVEGEPVGAVNRVPAANEVRSNMHVGGRPEPAELSPRDREICSRIGPDLKALGMVLVGIDVIGGLLTEINVTSPTGIREIARFGGADIAALTWDAIEARLASR